MSISEKFLDRWSRRKLNAADEPAPAEAKPGNTAPLRSKAMEEVLFDPAGLPPIESITAESDIRAFLRPGVPPDLTRAALRQAWSSDPKIRDFVGLVENGWDFNNTAAMPGFGPISTSEVARLLAGMIDSPRVELVAPCQVAAAQWPGPAQPAVQVSEPAQQLSQDRLMSESDFSDTEKDFVRRDEETVALQISSDGEQDFHPPRPHGHGGALPK